MITKQEREEFERDLKHGKFEHHTVDVQQVAKEIKSRTVAHEVAYDRAVDMVLNPPHYNQNGLETIDYMRAYSTKEEFLGHCRLTAIKYLSRLNAKDEPLENAKKARWYIDKMIEELEDD